MGLEPFIVSSALRLVLAQRLLRVNCENCKVEYEPHPRILERIERQLGQSWSSTSFRGVGCAVCGQSGYVGRTAVYETLKALRDGKSLKDLLNRDTWSLFLHEKEL